MFILIQLCMLACSGLFRKFFRYLYKSLQNFIYLSFQINLVSRQTQFDIVILLGAKGPQKGPQPSAGARRKDDVAPELLDYRSSQRENHAYTKGSTERKVIHTIFTHGGKNTNSSPLTNLIISPSFKLKLEFKIRIVSSCF